MSADAVSVVICTALDVEYLAVREHLHGPFTEREERGTLYEIGTFPTDRGPCRVALAQTGAGSAQAGIELERAISVFHPRLVLFAGVAGGRRDVSLGDVVIADHIYDYESGKDTATDFLPRIKTAAPSTRLLRRAQQLARDAAWQHRIHPAVPDSPPNAVVKPIATGGKVVGDAGSATARFLERHCGDAAAVEMEGHGFLHGAYVNDDVQALVVRGISDLLSGKSEAADERWQPIASRHAAAFAFELLAREAVPEAVLNGSQAYETARELEMSFETTVEDLVEIERLYREAAAAGHADAMSRVGLIAEGRLRASRLGQEPGEPSAADVETAMHWYAKSAELGSVFGALYLGRLYEERLGKPAEALKWYEKSAAGGHGDARSRLEGLQRRLTLRLGALQGRTPFDPTPLHRRPDERKSMAADTEHERWIEQEWGGSEQRALAFSLGDLEEASGGPYGEWGTLAEDEAVALLGHFCLLMPTRTHLPAVALEYCRSIGEGNLRKFAAGLRQGSGPQPEKLAPVWWLQRAENRISTEEFHYNFVLSVQDYDWLTSLVDDLIGYMAADGASNAEALLNLRMVSRELARRREQALRVSDGEDHREFLLLLTPEYFGTLRRLAAMQSDNQEADADFRTFWQRVRTALEAAKSTPFD
jgi:nucleoside phosphorylase